MNIATFGTVIDPSGAISGATETVKQTERVKTAFDKLVASFRAGNSILGTAFGGVGNGFAALANRFLSSTTGITGALAGLARAAAFTAGTMTAAFRGVLGTVRGISSAITGLIRGTVAGFAQLGLAISGFKTITAPAVGLIHDVIDSASEMESLRTQWAYQLGGFERAAAQMDKLSKFQKSTPFDLTEINKVALQIALLHEPLFEGEQALTRIGNAAARLGENFEQTGHGIKNMVASMKAGIGTGQYGSALEAAGVISPDKYLQLQKLATDASKFPEAMKILNAELERNAGAMELFSSKWAGMVNTAESAWNQLKATVGAPIIEGLKPLVSDLTGMIENLRQRAAELAPAIRSVALGVSAAFHIMTQSGGLELSFNAAVDTLRLGLFRTMRAVGIVGASVFDWIAAKFRAALEYLTTAEFWSGVSEALVEAANKMATALKDGIEAVFDDTKEKLKQDIVDARGAYINARNANPEALRSELRRRQAAGLTGPNNPYTGALPDDPAGVDAGGPSSLLLPPPPVSSFADAWKQAGEETTAAIDEYKERFDSAYNEAAQKAEDLHTKNEKLVEQAFGKNSALQAHKKEAEAAGGAGGSSKAQVDKLKTEADALIQALQTPQEALDAAISKFERMRAAGYLTGEQFSRAVLKAREDFAKATQQMAADQEAAANRMLTPLGKLMREWGKLSVEVQKASVGIAQTFETNITGALSDVVTGAKSAGDAFGAMALSIVNDIAKIVIKLMVQYAISKALGMVPGGGLLSAAGGVVGALFHTGGTVGDSGGSGRLVNAGTFATARRYHSGGIAGLQPGEVPAILEKGEHVLTRKLASETKRRLHGDKEPAAAARPQVTTINLFDPAQLAGMMARHPEAILNVIQMNPRKVKQALQ